VTEGEFPTLLPMREATGQIKPDGWYRGEMHCHTYHSDGDSDPLDVVRWSEARGLDFLAITDHNNISHLATLNAVETPLLLIPGFEVTTYKGHWNVWGDRGWIDFRIQSEAQMAQAIAEASRRGYVVSCNHPRPYGPDWVYPNVDAFDCIEVWNGPWQLFNHVALEFWESRLRQGRRYTAVGGSDSHFLRHEHHAKLAHPTMWIHCEGAPTAPKLLDSLRAGHVTLSESPDGARVTLNAGSTVMGETIDRPVDGKLKLLAVVLRGSGSTLEFHTAAGCVHRHAIQSEDAQVEALVDVTSTPYVRAQLVGQGDQPELVRALTNPIYIK
jgi:predicted metal-dependent phosphoesterase TrpH